jgi:hypothetical protein
VAGANAARFTFAAASLLVLIGVGLYVQQGKEPGLPVGIGNEQVLRSESVRNLQPSGDLEHPPDTISWIGISAAAKYRLRLLEVDGNELWKADTRLTSIQLPEDKKVLFVPAKTILLEITALDAAGNAMGSPGSSRTRVVLH